MESYFTWRLALEVGTALGDLLGDIIVSFME